MDEDKLLEKATSLAFRFLSYRPRSESEVRRRLEAKYPVLVAESVVQRLREQGLLDDTSFAQEWTRSRVSHRPRSAKAIRRELLGKGVDRDTAQAAVETLDDEESAYRAGLRAAASSGECRLQHLSTSSLGLPLPQGLQPGRHPQNREPIVGGEVGRGVSGVRSGIDMSIGDSGGASFSAHGEPVEPIEREQSSRSAHALR